jgi:ATP-dependent Zn protease
MTSQELLAYHEAAHAVVAIALRWEINQVTIIADRDTLGCCDIKDFELYFDGNRWTEEVKASARQAILYDLAGIAAELRINGDCDEFCGFDWDSAYTKAKHLTRTGDPQTYLDDALERSKKLVNNYWRHIGAVANALLEHKTLTGEDVYNIAGMKP